MPTTQRVDYVRVSSAGQNLARLLEAIGAVDKTYRESQSGSTTSQRPVLREALGYVREGDTLVVAFIDRLARCGTCSRSWRSSKPKASPLSSSLRAS